LVHTLRARYTTRTSQFHLLVLPGSSHADFHEHTRTHARYISLARFIRVCTLARFWFATFCTVYLTRSFGSTQFVYTPRLPPVLYAFVPRVYFSALCGSDTPQQTVYTHLPPTTVWLVRHVRVCAHFASHWFYGGLHTVTFFCISPHNLEHCSSPRIFSLPGCVTRCTRLCWFYAPPGLPLLRLHIIPLRSHTGSTRGCYITTFIARYVLDFVTFHITVYLRLHLLSPGLFVCVLTRTFRALPPLPTYLTIGYVHHTTSTTPLPGCDTVCAHARRLPLSHTFGSLLVWFWFCGSGCTTFAAHGRVSRLHSRSRSVALRLAAVTLTYTYTTPFANTLTMFASRTHTRFSLPHTVQRYVSAITRTYFARLRHAFSPVNTGCAVCRFLRLVGLPHILFITTTTFILAFYHTLTFAVRLHGFFAVPPWFFQRCGSVSFTVLTFITVRTFCGLHFSLQDTAALTRLLVCCLTLPCLAPFTGLVAFRTVGLLTFTVYGSLPFVCTFAAFAFTALLHTHTVLV